MRQSGWPRDTLDPFSVTCEYGDRSVTPLELAFHINKPERALLILEVTKGQTSTLL